MTQIERVARAICPLVKPWLDGPDVEPSPCNCKITDTPYGKGMPACLSICQDIAQAAIAAMWTPFDAKDESTWPEGDTPFVSVMADIVSAIVEQPLRWDTVKKQWIENDYGPFNTGYLNIAGQPHVTQYMILLDPPTGAG